MADRYWVGGSGFWDATSTPKWSTTSGGPGGASVPTASDAVIINASSGSPTITVSGTTRPCLSLTTTGATCTILGSTNISVFGNITLSATTTWSKTGFIDIQAASTITTNGVIINSSIAAAFDVTLGSALTLDSNRVFSFARILNLANFTLSTGSFVSITGTRVIQFGTGNITTTGSGTVFDVDGLNLTYTGTPTVNISNTSATAASIRANSFLENTAFDFNITTGTSRISNVNGWTAKSINFTGFAGSYEPSGSTTIYGSLTFVPGMTYRELISTVNFVNTSGTAILTSAGKNFYRIVMNGPGGTLRLADNLSVTSIPELNRFTLTRGTLDLANNTLTAKEFSSSNSNTRAITFSTSGQINFGVSGVDFATTTGFSYTGTGIFNNTNAATFAGGGGSFPTLNLGNSGILTVTGSNTFTNITNTVQPATLILTAATITTVNNFSLTGTPGNLVTLRSSTAGTQATLTKTGGGVIIPNYISVQDSIAAPANTWYAANSTGTNTSGWIFGNYFSDSVNENINATDSAFGLGTFVRSISEDISSYLDAPSTIASFSTAVSEGLAAGDINDEGTIFYRNVTDSTTVADIQAGVKIHNASIIEPAATYTDSTQCFGFGTIDNTQDVVWVPVDNRQ